MSNNTFDVNILVNGNRCKTYGHQGKLFVEAKNGSEYVVEIKNNHYKRILSVISIDGLNALTGKTASENDTGYVINAYSSEKIKGFRFSDNEWALFKFGYKLNGKPYAQSKEDGSEKNCGVIGLRIFYEKEPVVIYNTPIINIQAPYITPLPCQPWQPWYPWYSTTTCQTGASTYSGATYTSNVNYSCDNLGTQNMLLGNSCGESGMSAGQSVASAPAGNFTNCSQNYLSMCEEQPKLGFDIGTEFGRKEQSKVYTVEFERGCLAQSLDIYYASRKSLIEMGVLMENRLQVNLPQSFSGGYCIPPKDWVG